MEPGQPPYAPLSLRDRSIKIAIHGGVFILIAAQLLYLSVKPDTVQELVLGSLALFLVVKVALLCWHRKQTGHFPSATENLHSFLNSGQIIVILFLCLIVVHAINAVGYSQFIIVRVLKILLVACILFVLFKAKRHNIGEIGFYCLLSIFLMPFSSAFFTLEALNLPPLLIAYCLFLWYELRSHNSRETPINTIMLAVLAYVLVYVLLLPFSHNYYDSLVRLFYFIFFLLFLYTGLRFFATEKHFKRILLFIATIGAVFTLTSIVLFLSSLLGYDAEWTPGKAKKANIISTHVGMHFMCLALFYLFLLRKKNYRSFLIVGLLFLSNFFVLIQTHARASIGALLLGLLAGALAMLFFVKNKKYTGLAFAFLGMSGIFVYYALSIDLVRMFTSNSFASRLGLWQLALNIAQENLFAGNGTFLDFRLFTLPLNQTMGPFILKLARTMDPWTEPHNTYMAVLVSGGIPALGAFLFIFMSIFHFIFRSLKKASGEFHRFQNIFFLIPFVALLIVGLAESITVNFIAHLWFWLFLVLIIIYSAIQSIPVSLPEGLSVLIQRCRRQIMHRSLQFCLLGLFLAGYLTVGNIMAFQAMQNLAGAQSKIREIILLDPPQGAKNPKIEQKVALAEKWLKYAAFFVPFNHNVFQMQGETQLYRSFAPGLAPKDRLLQLIRAAQNYERAIARNTDSPSLWLRLSEIYGKLAEAQQTPYSASEKYAFRMARKLDPYDVYLSRW